MNPSYPPEAVALQGQGPDRHPGHPAHQTVVQYTTVNVSSEPPSDYVIWSICNLFYGNPFCLGLAAFRYSIKARDQKVLGNHHGAQHYGSKARCLNIWATVIMSLTALIFFIIIITLAVGINQAVSTVSSFPRNHYNSYGK